MSTSVPDLAEVLAEVNRLRAEHGLGEPLDTLPKGYRTSTTCPLAHAFGYPVGVCFLHMREVVALPRTLEEFVDAFDSGAYRT